MTRKEKANKLIRIANRVKIVTDYYRFSIIDEEEATNRILNIADENNIEL